MVNNIDFDRLFGIGWLLFKIGWWLITRRLPSYLLLPSIHCLATQILLHVPIHTLLPLHPILFLTVILWYFSRRKARYYESEVSSSFCKEGVPITLRNTISDWNINLQLPVYILSRNWRPKFASIALGYLGNQPKTYLYIFEANRRLWALTSERYYTNVIFSSIYIYHRF